MDSTTQWSISWTMALRPPQEMLPSESLFRTLTDDSSTTATIEHLFGFAPCIPSFYTGNSISMSSKDDTLNQTITTITADTIDATLTTDTQDIDNEHEVNEDFQVILAFEKYTCSL